ncbi:alkaline phosphatase [Shouchella lonarensis]|uniref:Alkaline phosphatase n=1 Tax=Shouchella lonarensis TaxID=1464122 RepID=A0A1G6KNW7_9BACI|nr:alkaline phosphatase [Shouchella lonarensis]SDC32740.1 alkaline phosphatase [Shouchella lonarensis]
MKFKNCIVAFGAVLTLSAAYPVQAVDQHVAPPEDPSTKTAKNVIFLVPDGFSQSYASSYRLYKEDGLPIWDEKRMLRGGVQTYSADRAITDSAAAATALASGKKTNNGMVGLTPDGKEVTTMVDVAKQHGKRTGLVATSTITHATPAAFATHVQSRNEYLEIANQLVHNENVDLLFGGGRHEFMPSEKGGLRKDGQNLIEKAKESGYGYIETVNDLETWSGDEQRLLGLFADEALQPVLERGQEEPSLAEMTTQAINFLSQEEAGFFLMVEGSQIDWGGHDNDAAYAMTEMAEFDDAVKVAVDFADTNEETLIVIVADHDTGGMAVHATDKAHPSMLHGVKATGGTIASKVKKNFSNLKKVLEDQTNFKWDSSELKRLKKSKDFTLELNRMISEKAGIAWTTTGHTGVDVPLYAYGVGADLFYGTMNNTDVPGKMSEALGISGF